MNRAELINHVRKLLPAGSHRRAIDDGSVRVLGEFQGPCGSQAFIVLRAVSHFHGTRTVRRITYFAIGEFNHPRLGQLIHRAGRIDKLDWTAYLGAYTDTVELDIPIQTAIRVMTMAQSRVLAAAQRKEATDHGRSTEGDKATNTQIPDQSQSE